MIKIKFSRTACGPCARRSDCTKAPRRTLTVRPRDQYLALQAARQRETTPDYKAQYTQRAGVEGTISQGVRALGLRRARYMGLAKTHLQHILTAAAINFTRVADWLAGNRPTKTRVSSFAAMMAQPVAG